MPNKIWQDSWPDRNRQRNYPLAEEASATDGTGAFKIPLDFLIGLRLPVDCGMVPDPGRFFILRIAAYSTGYQVTVGYQPVSGSAVVAAIASVSADGFTQNKIVPLLGQGDYEESVGWIMVGRLDSIASQPSGQFTFSVESGRLEADCIIPDIRGISGFRVENRGILSPRYTGDIELVAGRNSRISGSSGVITVDFIDGEGSIEDCECEEDPGTPVLRINGVGPGPTGDIAIPTGTCLGLTAGTNQISLTNECAQPCCGCPELEVLTQRVSTIPSQLATLRGFVTRLENLGQTTQQVLLGSRLGNRVCDS